MMPRPSGAPTSGCRIYGPGVRAQALRCRRAGSRSPAAISSDSLSATEGGWSRSAASPTPACGQCGRNRSTPACSTRRSGRRGGWCRGPRRRSGRCRHWRSICRQSRPRIRRCSFALRYSPIPGPERSRSGAPMTARRSSALRWRRRRRSSARRSTICRRGQSSRWDRASRAARSTVRRCAYVRH